MTFIVALALFVVVVAAMLFVRAVPVTPPPHRVDFVAILLGLLLLVLLYVLLTRGS